jgi:hypothetical protein
VGSIPSIMFRFLYALALTPFAFLYIVPPFCRLPNDFLGVGMKPCKFLAGLVLHDSVRPLRGDMRAVPSMPRELAVSFKLSENAVRCRIHHLLERLRKEARELPDDGDAG